MEHAIHEYSRIGMENGEILRYGKQNRPVVPFGDFARRHNVSPDAFSRRLRELLPINAHAGSDPYFTREQELKLVDYCCFRARIGLSMHKKELKA